MNLDKTSNLGQKFAQLNTLLYHKLLHAIALAISSLFIDNVTTNHLYVVWQTKVAEWEVKFRAWWLMNFMVIDLTD